MSHLQVLRLLSTCSWVELQKLSPLVKEVVMLRSPENTESKTMLDACMKSRILDRR